MICPVCDQEGQAITCIAGNVESQIVFHADKQLRNICSLVSRGDAESAEE